MKGFCSLLLARAFSLRLLVSLFGFQSAFFQASAQITLADGNSVAQINPFSQAGMYYWAVQNSPTTLQNQLNKQWFWYRVGSAGPENSIDTLLLINVSQPTLNSATMVYSSPGLFNLTVAYSLLGGAPTSGAADITEQIRIDNISGAVLPYHFFQYSDFNMGGDGANDSVFLSRNGFTFKFSQADQLDGANIVEVTTTPNANHAEADFVPNTLNKLNDLLPTTLDDTKTNAGPGDVAWAFEWDVNIAVGGSLIISKDKGMTIPFVPEPSALALIPLAMGTWACYRRRRERG